MRIGELEKDKVIFHDRVAVLEAEKDQLIAQPSFYRTSKLYNEWIHAEAQLDVFRELHKARSVFEVALEVVRVKAREARITWGYDPTTPEGDEGDDEGVDRLEEDAWYDTAYLKGEGGNIEGDPGGEGINGQGGKGTEDHGVDQ